MKTIVILICFFLSIVLSFLPFYFEFTPGYANTASWAGWIFSFLSVLFCVYFVFFYLPQRLALKRKLYSTIIILATLVFLIIKLLLFSFSSGVDAMWPDKLEAAITLPENGEELYVFSSSAFPDPGENIIIKRKNGWFPAMEKIFEARSFDYAGFEKDSNGIIFRSKENKAFTYSYKEHTVR